MPNLIGILMLILVIAGIIFFYRRFTTGRG